MNKKICLYTPPFPRIKSYYDMIDTAVEYNINAVEGFNMFEFELPNIEEAKKIKEYADSKNVIFPCFSVYANLVGEDSDEMISRLKGYADVAAVLGSPYLHHTIACEFSNPDNIIPYKDELFKVGVSAVREIYDYAQSLGVKTIYEEQGYLFNGVEGFGRFLDEVDREVGVVADFANIYQAGDDISEFINAYAHRFVHAHIKDITLTDTNPTGLGLKTLADKYMNEAQIGKGIVNISKTIEQLKNAGYDGYYGIEYAASDDSSTVVDESIRLISSLL